MKNILKTLVTRKELAAVAMGQIKADKVIKNGNLIDVYTGKIRRADIAAALNRLIAIQGGVVVCREGRILAELSLPIGGLMTAQPYEETIKALEAINRAAGELGCVLPSPLMTLAFAGCPTLVEFKLSDKGLINILEGSLAPLEVD